MDMHSGGGCKVGYDYIYIEALEEEAIEIFKNRFGRDPLHTTCDSCGQDYSISEEYISLQESTVYERRLPLFRSLDNKEWRYFEKEEDVPQGWIPSEFNKFTPWNEVISLEDFLKEDVLVIYKEEITRKDD
jgi:hypothetical protein